MRETALLARRALSGGGAGDRGAKATVCVTCAPLHTRCTRPRHTDDDGPCGINDCDLPRTLMSTTALQRTANNAADGPRRLPKGATASSTRARSTYILLLLTYSSTSYSSSKE
jgi:hypothetical protein